MAGDGQHLAEIYDMCGRLQYSEIFRKNTTIDLRNLPAGVYLIKLYTDGETIVKKVVINQDR